MHLHHITGFFIKTAKDLLPRIASLPAPLLSNLYVLTGQKDTAADVLPKGLLFLEGKYLLGDAGFSASPKLLTPCRCLISPGRVGTCTFKV